MLKFTLPVDDEIAFSKMNYGEKLFLMQLQLDVYMLSHGISAKSIELDPETRQVTLRGEEEH